MSEQKVKLKKHLRQNLLINKKILEQVTSTIFGDIVVEIGPGTGNLTEFILKNESIKRLILIEKDPEMVAFLKKRFVSDKIKFFIEDAATFSLERLNLNNEKAFIIGNFPYNLSNAVINFAQQTKYVSKIVAILQKEVVQRFCALPKSKEYGKLTILCNLFCDTRKIMDIGSGNFVPQPKVISSVLEATPKKNICINKDLFNKIIKICNIGFNNRRKKLLSTLGSIIDKEKIINLLKDKNARIEELKIEQIIELAMLL